MSTSLLLWLAVTTINAPTGRTSSTHLKELQPMAKSYQEIKILLRFADESKDIGVSEEEKQAFNTCLYYQSRYYGPQKLRDPEEFRAKLMKYEMVIFELYNDRDNTCVHCDERYGRWVLDGLTIVDECTPKTISDALYKRNTHITLKMPRFHLQIFRALPNDLERSWHTLGGTTKQHEKSFPQNSRVIRDDFVISRKDVDQIMSPLKLSMDIEVHFEKLPDSADHPDELVVRYPDNLYKVKSDLSKKLFTTTIEPLDDRLYGTGLKLYTGRSKVKYFFDTTDVFLFVNSDLLQKHYSKKKVYESRDSSTITKYLNGEIDEILRLKKWEYASLVLLNHSLRLKARLFNSDTRDRDRGPFTVKLMTPLLLLREKYSQKRRRETLRLFVNHVANQIHNESLDKGKSVQQFFHFGCDSNAPFVYLGRFQLVDCLGSLLYPSEPITTLKYSSTSDFTLYPQLVDDYQREYRPFGDIPYHMLC